MKVAFSGLLVAGAILTASSATVAAPISASVIKQAADEIAVAETVHCRSIPPLAPLGIRPRLPRRRRALRSARAIWLQRKGTANTMIEGIVTLGLPCRVTGTVTLTSAIAMRGRNQNGNRRAFARPDRERRATAERPPAAPAPQTIAMKVRAD